MHLPAPLTNDILQAFKDSGVESISIEYNPRACILRLKLPPGVQKTPVEEQQNTAHWRSLNEPQRAALRAATLDRWNRISSAYAQVFRHHFPDHPPPRLHKIGATHLIETHFHPDPTTPTKTPSPP